MVAGLDSVHASRSERRTNSESRQRRASHATGTHLTRILHLCQKAHLSSHSAAQSTTETTCHPARTRTRAHATNATARHTREPKPNRTNSKLVHEQTISQTNRSKRGSTALVTMYHHPTGPRHCSQLAPTLQAHAPPHDAHDAQQIAPPRRPTMNAEPAHP